MRGNSRFLIMVESLKICGGSFDLNLPHTIHCLSITSETLVSNKQRNGPACWSHTRWTEFYHCSNQLNVASLPKVVAGKQRHMQRMQSTKQTSKHTNGMFCAYLLCVQELKCRPSMATISNHPVAILCA